MFSRKVSLILVTLAVLIIIFVVSCDQEGAHEENTISYNFQVRPILSDKCFACHGPDGNKRKAGFRLDLADSAFLPLKETKGAFALVPGKPEESEIYKRVISSDPGYQMPVPESHLGLLSQEEQDIIKQWIAEGAKYEKHWAFTPPKKSKVPAIENTEGVKNEIDNFVIAAQKQKGLAMNPEADKERLLRRLSLDLTGLPPTIGLMDSFLADKSPDAYEKMVERLLHRPSYGEKMTLHWLDVARYADSYGYQDDNIRTQWPWRDWVIHAFNENIPYDKFLTMQIAGDMLPEATKEDILATGFFRNHKYTEEGGVIPEEYRIEYILDKTKTFSKGIMGITMECAQCHDHKYDPFSQQDYYSLFAFFNNTREVGYEGDVSVSTPAKKPLLEINDADRKDLLNFINYKDTGKLTVSVLGELDTMRQTYVLDRGVYDAPAAPVQPHAVPAVMKYDTTEFPRNRLGLAAWTVDRNNPLTARVYVNQLWQELFGRGIVKTTGDFGMQGELPTHPQLLDWLAVDFMEHHWDIKRLVKQIVMSATYRQSAKLSKEAINTDPENIFLSYAPRIRLPAEQVRDLLLATSGLLVKEIGGPSVKPYQPKGLWEAASSGRGVLATYQQDHEDDLYRRGIYTFIKLTVPPPSMVLFDASNRDQCEVKRLNTNTPLQALMMLNDPTMLEASRVLAEKLAQEKLSSTAKITKAFRLITSRTPDAKELEVLQSYFDDQLASFKNRKLDAALTLKPGEFPQMEVDDKNAAAALMKTISAIYNLEESIMKS